ncbi:Pleckstrin homology domain-containing protein [Aspergillus avenaceus]|uniref:Pleckstrin homology domain-containing protein n=1 Tax=Aspergillus avenaceus TaxID=36643 RepID=A0A5N6TCQ3_ASPAV|nr:Pleckstrin homology domain-containing protein [Aspergillus avenaceus]
MSDTQKPVEETPVAASTTAPVTDTTVTEATIGTETPAAEAPQETPAGNTEATPAPEEDKGDETATEQPKEDKKEEVTPASEGVLGHKAPGLVKGLRFSKRFFYLSEDAVEAKQLASFHQNEKPVIANPIAAWASQTGKGLLFYTKRAEDKSSPVGIFNLADVTDVTKEGSSEFIFKVNGHKHTFQAASVAERDSWVAAIEAKTTEAKAEKEAITSSEGYKAELEKLNKPVTPEPTKKPADKPAEAKDETKEEGTSVEENKDSKAKSRSQSRKRASIFGTLLGKKDEAEEKKEQDKPEESKTTEAATETTAEAPASAEPAEAATAAPADSAEKEDKEDEKKEDKKAETKSKRASLFGNFFQKVTSPSHEKSEKDAAAPAETTAVASTAPQLDNPVEEAAVKPIEPESVTAPAEAEASKDVAPSSPAAETPKDKRRTSFFGNFGKKKGDSDNEAETESKPKGNKLGGLFRKPSKAVKSDTKEAAATETEAKPDGAPKEATVQESAEEAQPEVPGVSSEETKPANIPPTSAPVQAAA